MDSLFQNRHFYPLSLVAVKGKIRRIRTQLLMTAGEKAEVIKRGKGMQVKPRPKGPVSGHE